MNPALRVTSVVGASSCALLLAPSATAQMLASAKSGAGGAAVTLSVEGPLRDPRPYPPDIWVPVWHSLGLMAGMRLTEAWLWPEPFAETRPLVLAQQYEQAFTRPPKWDSSRAWFEWDGDPWMINVVGHAAFGAELYFRPRVCGHDVLPALVYAAGGTVLWDYGFEATGVRPSGLDLWYTPLSGAILGEVRYWGYQAASGIDDRTLRAVVQTVFDPFGQIERALGSRC